MEPSGREPGRAAGSQPDLRRPRCRRSGRLSLSSRSPDPPGPDDRLRGPSDRPAVVIYADFECPRCALAWERVRSVDLRLGLRHFPVGSAHPRARPAACAAEAAGEQGRFWEMVESLFADAGRLEDPHLWERASELGLDLARFDEDRRSQRVADRVESDFRLAVRAGVATTPAFLVGGGLFHGVPDRAVLEDWVAGRYE